jgi:hypothetical protein
MSADSLALAATLGWDSIARRTAAIYARLAGVRETELDSEEGMLGQVAGVRRT